MSFLEYATNPSISNAEKSTIELLMDSVAWQLDDHDDDSAADKDEKRSAAGYVPQINPRRMARVEELILQRDWISFQMSHVKVVSLEPLKYLKNLRGIVLGQNAVEDLSPLASLPELERLSFRRIQLAASRRSH